MWNNVSEFEVRIKGHNLVHVNNGEVKIDGRDFHQDLRNIASLIDILSDILHKAEEAKKPRLVFADGNMASAPEKPVSDPKPYKVVSR